MQTSPNNFSLALERALKSKGWNKTRLAREMNIANSSISRWLNGAAPSLETLRKLSEVLGPHAKELLEMVPGGELLLTPKREDYRELPSVVNEEMPRKYFQNSVVPSTVINLNPEESWERAQVSQMAGEILARAKQISDTPEEKRPFVLGQMRRIFSELEQFLTELPCRTKEPGEKRV